MKQKILLFAMSAILLASCVSKKKVARAYQEGKRDGRDLAVNENIKKLNQVMDSMSELKETTITVHDTLVKTVEVVVPNKSAQQPSKDIVLKADFDFDHFIGYPELNNKFFTVSPTYVDSVLVTSKNNVPVYAYMDKSIDVYIPVDDYNILKQKKKVVTIYANWRKLCGEQMHTFDYKGNDCVYVLAGIKYSNPGVKVNFTPATIKEDPPAVNPSSQTKTDPGKAVINNSAKCPNPPDCSLLWPKTLNPETCNCE